MLRSASWENDSIGLAEALWLARFLPRAAASEARQNNDAALRPADGKSHTERDTKVSGNGNLPPQPISGQPGKKPSTEEMQARIFSSSGTPRGDEFVPASAVRVATGAALPGALRLGRALRPLIRYRPSKFIDELDENATAENSAENGRRVTPVFRPVRERLLDVALVIDDSPSMVVWRKTVTELQSLLERHGAFRDVRRWTLKLAPKLQLVSNSGTHVSPKALLDPTGQRLIVLFTQGTHPAWAQRELAKWLWLWGSKCPLAIAHALPDSLWANTKLGEATAQARTLHAAVPNTRLTVERPWWYEPDGPPTLAVPAFSLEPEAMARWAQMAMGVRGTPGPALLFELPENIVDAPVENPAAKKNTTAEEWVSRFQEHASEEAYDLACYLSQLQFSLPVMRLVQSALFGNRASQTHLAEVLLSGMVESVMLPPPPAGGPIAEPAGRGISKPEEPATGDAEEVVYRLKADFRTLLRPRLKLDPTFTVIRALTRHIEQRLGEPVDFTALVPDEHGQYKLPRWAQPFAVAGAALADQLGLAPSAREPAPAMPDLPPVTDNTHEGLSDLRPVRRFPGDRNSFRRIAWSTDGRLLAAGSFDKLVRIYDAQSGALQNAMSGHSEVVYTVGWSADSTMLASGSRDGTIRIWDSATGQTIHTLTVEGGSVLGLAWSPVGQTIACGTDYGRVIVWDAAARSQPLYFRHHREPVHMVAWSPDGKMLASASNDGSVAIISSLSGHVEHKFSGPGQIYGLAWSTDGKTLAFAGSGGTIRLVKPDRSDIATLSGHTGAITDISFSADGALLASISWDNTVRIWDVRDHVHIATLQAKSARLFHSGIAFQPGRGHSIAIVTDEASSIEIRQPATEKTFQELTDSVRESRDEIAGLVASEPEIDALFKRMMEVVKRFVDFDWANICILSPDQKHSRVICFLGPAITYQKTRWFRVNFEYVSWIMQSHTWVADLEDFSSASQYSPESPDVRAAIDVGQRAMVALPAYEGEGIRGWLCLISQKRGIYGSETLTTLRQLALDKALLAVFNAVERAENLFVTDLLKKMDDAKDLRDIAVTAVADLARFYGFETIAIFKVNALRGRFQLLAEAVLEGVTPMPEGYTQRLDEGLLGVTYRRGEAVLLNDIDDGSEEAKYYVPVAKEVRSELCIPIRVFGKILWILCVGDRHRSAFAAIEVQTLQRIMQGIEATLDRVQNRALGSDALAESYATTATRTREFLDQVSVLRAYTSLHNQLHELRFQLEPARTIVRSSISQKTAPRQLRQLPFVLDETLHAVRDLGDRLPAEQIAWTERIAAARNRIVEGLRRADITSNAIIRDAIIQISRVLDIESQRINSIMVETYRAMRLDTLITQFRSLPDVQLAAFDKFLGPLETLERLDKEVGDLLDLHDAWQHLDTEMRLLELDVNGPKQFALAWPRIRSRAIALGQRDKESERYQKSTEAIDFAVEAEDWQRAALAFRDYQEDADLEFYQVSQLLLQDIRELEGVVKSIGEAVPLA